VMLLISQPTNRRTDAIAQFPIQAAAGLKLGCTPGSIAKAVP